MRPDADAPWTSVVALAAAGQPRAAVAAAPTRTSTSPPPWPTQIADAKARSDVPVWLPATMTAERGHCSAAAPRHAQLAMGLDAAPDCGGANACFVASFTGERGGTPFGDTRVRLRGGRTGHFTPLSCGGSCAPPQIQWKMGSTLYTIQARVGNKSTERRMLVRMANSAILHAPPAGARPLPPSSSAAPSSAAWAATRSANPAKSRA